MTSTVATPATHSANSLGNRDADGNANAEVNPPSGYVGGLLRQPWFLCALVLMVALMGSFVHVLVGQVEHGEQIRKGYVKWGAQPPGTEGQLMVEAAQPPLLPVHLGSVR